MLRSRARFTFLTGILFPAAMAAALTSLSACAAKSTSVDDPNEEGTPTPSPTTPTTPTTPEKITFEYSSVPLPAANVRVASIGGSSKSDVWVVAAASGASEQDPWTAYHYDGKAWETTALTAQTGRPSFGAVSLGGSNVYLGFSYAADIFQLSGSTFTKKTSFSVTSGYTMAAVGSTVFIGTQENFGAGPLYVIDAGASKQVSGVTQGRGGVVDVWGVDADDVWLARSGGLGHLVDGVYEDTSEPAASKVHGTAKDDVWALTASGVRHYDGKSWKDVTFPTGSSSTDKPRTLNALSKDEVIVTTSSNVYRYDGKEFVKDTRTDAPKTASVVGRIGKDEAWAVSSTSISRLAPEGK